MDDEARKIIQQRANDIKIPYFERIHKFQEVPDGFLPWNVNLSPSALYNCSLAHRKLMKIKTPEVKWVSIKRWTEITPWNIKLPAGVYLSIKRKEEFVASPEPHFSKQEFILMMFPYGNVWSQRDTDVPITEDWLWSNDTNGKLILESLMLRDAAKPILGYFKSAHKYMVCNPLEIGIHKKRAKKL